MTWREGAIAIALAFLGALAVIELLPRAQPGGGFRLAGQWIYDAWLIAIPLFLRFALGRAFPVGSLVPPARSRQFAIGTATCLVACAVAAVHLAGLRAIYSNTIMYASDIFTGCTIVPLSEELLFRGVVQTGLNRSLRGSWRGVRTGTLAAALLFGLMHGLNAFTSTSPAVVLAGAALAGGFGLIAGLLYQRTNNLWAAVVLHGLANALGF